jgi:hypothetical protein
MFFLLKDWIAVESNRFVCNATSPKKVADSLCYQDNNLERTGIKDLSFVGTDLTVVGIDNQAHHSR